MNILIIEDSKGVSHILETILRANGHVSQSNTSKEVDMKRIRENLFEIVIMDINLTYGSIRMLKEIRKENINTFILGISTKGTWKEKVSFLNNGGDDVLDYPFPMQELFARINCLLGRPKEHIGGILRVGDIEIDTLTKQVSVKRKGVRMRKREYQLLEYMARNKGRTISRAELLDHVWDYRRSTGSNTVDVHVKRLRDKIMDRDIIETIHGFGYTIKEEKPSLKHHRHD